MVESIPPRGDPTLLPVIPFAVLFYSIAHFGSSTIIKVCYKPLILSLPIFLGTSLSTVASSTFFWTSWKSFTELIFSTSLTLSLSSSECLGIILLTSILVNRVYSIIDFLSPSSSTFSSLIIECYDETISKGFFSTETASDGNSERVLAL